MKLRAMTLSILTLKLYKKFLAFIKILDQPVKVPLAFPTGYVSLKMVI